MKTIEVRKQSESFKDGFYDYRDTGRAKPPDDQKLLDEYMRGFDYAEWYYSED